MMSYIGHRKEFLRLTFLWTGAFFKLILLHLEGDGVKILARYDRETQKQ